MFLLSGGLSVEQPTWTNTSVLRRVLAVSLLQVWKWKKCQPFGLKSKLLCCLSGKFDLLIGFIWYAPITCCPFFSHYNSSHDAMMPNSFILWCQKHWLTIRSVVSHQCQRRSCSTLAVELYRMLHAGPTPTHIHVFLLYGRSLPCPDMIGYSTGLDSARL